ncbi:MAG: hypothetical protein ISR54_02230 [Chlorobium phaeobacteroides]|nr:hypothetical protein [Chlorobium phaeobacteroides]MBL6955630.1 hypothetical protein [Chlorobium phaeobacteroides]
MHVVRSRSLQKKYNRKEGSVVARRKTRRHNDLPARQNFATHVVRRHWWPEYAIPS